MKQEKKEAMLKLEPAHTDNRSLATRTRRFFTVPSGRNGLKIATIFFLCVLIVTFFTFFIGAAKNNYQPYRHHDDRHVYFSRRNVAVKIPSKSTTDGRTPTSRFPPSYFIVALILICIGYFFRELLDYIRRWRSEPSQHPGPLPSTDAGSSSTAADAACAATDAATDAACAALCVPWPLTGSSTTATDAACTALCVPWPSTANRHRSPLSEDEMHPVSHHHASSRMRVAPRREEERNLFETRSWAPAGDRDSVVPTIDGCEALSSDESPEHRLVLRRRHYEDRSPYPSPCGSSATSPDHDCGERIRSIIYRICPTATDPIQPELCYEGEHLQGSLPRQDYDPIHDTYLHSGDPAVEDVDQNPDWSGSISFRFLLSVPDAGGDEPGLGGAEDVDAPTVSAVAAAGDGDDDGNGDDDEEMSVPSWVGPPVLPR